MLGLCEDGSVRVYVRNTSSAKKVTKTLVSSATLTYCQVVWSCLSRFE